MSGDFRAPADGQPYLLTNATVPAACLAEPAARTDDLCQVDLLIRDGRIDAVGPGLAAVSEPSLPRIELDHEMLWPAFVDMHTHLDKGQTWPRGPNPDGSFDGALNANLVDRQTHWTADDVRRRMDFNLRCAYGHGSRVVRTHIDSAAPQHRISWPVFAELRETWRGRIELQAASLIGIGKALDRDFLAELCAIIVEAGGILGAVTFAIPELDAALERLFDAAEAHGLELDLHVDESGNGADDGLRRIAEITLARGFKGRVVCGHCCSLARQGPGEAARTLDLVARAGIAVVSLPMCNMYLQDRSPGATPRWRGVTLLKEMAVRGIPVAIASDNVRDPFYAYGDLDMLEVFREAVRILQLDHPFADWPAAVTNTPAAIIGSDYDALIGPGRAADLVLFHARDWTELLARPQSDRVLLRAGQAITAELPDYRELDDLVRK